MSREAQRLKRCRETAGVSHQHMADHLGVTRQAYGMLESGKRRLRLDQAVEAYHLLGYELVVMPQIEMMDYERAEELDRAPVTASEKLSLIRRLFAQSQSAAPDGFKMLGACLKLNADNTELLHKIIRAFLRSPAKRGSMCQVVEALSKD